MSTRFQLREGFQLRERWRRGGARSTMTRPLCSDTKAPARVRRKWPVEKASSERFAQRLELAELDRPLVAHLPDRAADQAQCNFCRQFLQTSGVECDRVRRSTRTEPRRTPRRPLPRCAASLRRTRRANWTSRCAVRPSCANAGASPRQRTRAKRGSELLGSSAWLNPAASSVAMRRAFGMSSRGRTSAGLSPASRIAGNPSGDTRAMAAMPERPLPRARRNSTVSAWSSRVCAVTTQRAPARRAAAAADGSARHAPSPEGR